MEISLPKFYQCFMIVSSRMRMMKMITKFQYFWDKFTGIACVTASLAVQLMSRRMINISPRTRPLSTAVQPQKLLRTMKAWCATFGQFSQIMAMACRGPPPSQLHCTALLLLMMDAPVPRPDLVATQMKLNDVKFYKLEEGTYLAAAHIPQTKKSKDCLFFSVDSK